MSDSGEVSATDNWRYELVVCDEASAVGYGFFAHPTPPFLY